LCKGRSTLDETAIRHWLLGGGVTKDEALPADLFVAAVRSRQSDELIVLMTDGQRRFSFLERMQSGWTSSIIETGVALEEAFERWDAGETVHYAHGFAK
jgi:hypothetical protein